MKLYFKLFVNAFVSSSANGINIGTLRKRPETPNTNQRSETDQIKRLKRSLKFDSIIEEKKAQKGLFIEEDFDFRSIDVSPDGTTLIVGAPECCLSDRSGIIGIYNIATSELVYKYVGYNPGDLVGTSVAMISNSEAVAGAPGYNSGGGVLYLFETDGTAWTFKDMVIGLGGLGENIDVARDVGWYVTGMPSSTSGVSVLFSIVSSRFFVLDYVSYPGSDVGISSDGNYIVSSNTTDIMLSFCNSTCTEVDSFADDSTYIGVENDGTNVVVATSSGNWYAGATSENFTVLTESANIPTEECSLDGFGSSFDMGLDPDTSYPIVNIGAPDKYAGRGSINTYLLNSEELTVTMKGSEMFGDLDENLGQSTAMSSNGSVIVNGGLGIVRIFDITGAQTSVIPQENAEDPSAGVTPPSNCDVSDSPSSAPSETTLELSRRAFLEVSEDSNPQQIGDLFKITLEAILNAEAKMIMLNQFIVNIIGVMITDGSAIIDFSISNNMECDGVCTEEVVADLQDSFEQAIDNSLTEIEESDLLVEAFVAEAEAAGYNELAEVTNIAFSYITTSPTMAPVEEAGESSGNTLLFAVGTVIAIISAGVLFSFSFLYWWWLRLVPLGDIPQLQSL